MEYFALMGNPDPIIVNCPVCLRVMWKNGTCHHGMVPETTKGDPKEDTQSQEVLDGGTTRRKRRVE